MNRFTLWRRGVMAAFLVLFILQIAKINIVAGSLTGSVALSYIRLLDPFAYLESLSASGDFTLHALWSVLPIVALYAVFGRAFCGWVCPMDYLFEVVERLRQRLLKVKGMVFRLPRLSGYILALLFLIITALIGAPVFTNYLSHLTNLYRAITAGYFYLLDLPLDLDIFVYSTGAIIILLVLELIAPRLWCKSLCPVGRTYGLFNKFSLLRLSALSGTCQQCDLCNKACYMGVNISGSTHGPSIRDTDCIMCGRCIESCREKGKTLKLTFKKETQ
jgi:ferredoxin-type protein NapH